MSSQISRKLSQNQKILAIFMIALLVVQTISMAFTPLKANAQSVPGKPGKVTYEGSATWTKDGIQTKVGKFKVDGKIAFCLDHDKLTPDTGYAMSNGEIYKNESIRAILYYGAGGPGGEMGTSDLEIISTSIALDAYMNKGGVPEYGSWYYDLPGFGKLMDHGKNKDAPSTQFELSRSNLTSSVSGDVQKSQSTTLKADSSNNIKLNLPSGVTLVNETTGAKKTGGTVTVKGGETFHFEASLSRDSNFSANNIGSAIGEYQSIIFHPQGSNSSAYQRLGQIDLVDDPGKKISLNVEFEAREGWIEVTKKGNDTDKPLSGATYEIKDGNKVVDTVTTGSNGKAKTKPLLPNKSYTVTETKAPKGYTLNDSSKNIKVNAGKTTSTSFTNKAVLGQIEITKTDENEDLIKGAEYDVLNSKGDVVDELVTGDNGKAISKKLPLGKYEIVETFVPEPLIIDRTPIKAELTYKDQYTALVKTNVEQENEIAKGEVLIGKVDYKTKKPVSDATYGLYNSDDKLIQEATTNEDGVAIFKEVELGTYYVQEIEAPPGYKLDTQKYFTTIKYKDMETPIINVELGDKINQHRVPSIGTTASFAGLDKDNPNMTTLTDIVEYNDLYAENEYTLKGVLMDKHTGEEVLIDGKPITAEKTFTTKSIDGEESLEFNFDQSKLETDTVVVFEKLYQENEAGEEEVIATHEDIEDVNQTVELPKVGTSASFEELDKKDPNITTLIDVVEYSGLIPGKEYTVDGVLMNKETGEPIIIDDKEVTGSTTFTPEKSNGTVDVEFTFDQSKLETKTVVVFEDLYDEDMLWAVHHDINDVDQTVEIPEVGTKASFEELNKKDPNIATLVDVVEYKDLIVGEEYTVTGKLMDKETGEPILIDDKEVTGETTFTAEEKDGVIEVEFTFDKSKLETDTVVVFEDLYNGEKLIAVHHDINDKEQTVEIPDVGTKASFEKIEENEPNISTIVDVVEYSGLIPGKEYTVDGILMDKETGEPIEIEGDDEEVIEEDEKEKEDKEEVNTTNITGSTTFTPEEPNGSVEVEFTFDKSKLETKTVVVFEDLYQEDRLIAVHHDINDKEQTVDIPEVGTTASFVGIDEEDTNLTTLVDVVKYEGLKVGKEYTVTGKLMNKETGEPIIIDDKEVTGSTTFTAETSDGEVDVMFVFDQSKLETDTVVVFEDLFDGENLIAIHHDITDVDQTVEIPEIETEASFTERDEKETNMVTITDIVTYEKLIPGKEYTVDGVLMDKETEEPIIIDGKEVTGSTTFTPEEPNGSVEVDFTFDQSQLEAESVVVFEDLHDGENLIAVHHDINDEAQTVDVIEVEVVKVASDTGKKLRDAEFTMFDLDGNVIDVQVTDKKGIATFKIMDGEEVVIEETKAPQGYEINEKQSTKQIKAEGENVSFEVENDRVPGEPLPATATDMFNMAVIGLGFLALAGALGFYFIRKRKSANVGE